MRFARIGSFVRNLKISIFKILPIPAPAQKNKVIFITDVIEVPNQGDMPQKGAGDGEVPPGISEQRESYRNQDL